MLLMSIWRTLKKRCSCIHILHRYWSTSGLTVGPCHAIAPNLIKAVEEENGRILLAKLEVDEGDNMKLAGRYNVRGFPTIMLFQNGENVAHFTSARPMHFIREFLHQHLGPENSN